MSCFSSILEMNGNNDIGIYLLKRSLSIDLYTGMTIAILSDPGTTPGDRDLLISILCGYEISYFMSLINAGVILLCPELFLHLIESINVVTSFESVGARNMFF